MRDWFIPSHPVSENHLNSTSKRELPRSSWRTDCWDPPLCTSLVGSAAFHMLVLFGVAHTLTDTLSGHAVHRHFSHQVLRPDVLLVAGISDDQVDTEDAIQEDAGDMEGQRELDPIVRILESHASKRTPDTKENDWPVVEVPKPRRILSSRSAGSRRMQARVTVRERKSAKPPVVSEPSACDPNECNGKAWGHGAKSCASRAIQAATARAFSGLHGFWSGHSESSSLIGGRMILRWKISTEGRVNIVEILRDDVQDTAVRRWAMARAQEVRYDPASASGCRLTWHLGFGINLKGMHETLEEITARLIQDKWLDAGEASEVHGIIYDDRLIDIAEVEFLYQVSLAMEEHSIDPAWETLVLKAMTDYLEGIGATLPPEPDTQGAAWQMHT